MQKPAPKPAPILTTESPPTSTPRQEPSEIPSESMSMFLPDILTEQMVSSIRKFSSLCYEIGDSYGAGVRLAILSVLSTGPTTPTAILAHLNKAGIKVNSHSTISTHLSRLKSKGIVSSEVRGTSRIYSIDPGFVSDMAAIPGQIFRSAVRSTIHSADK